jgi:organic radical activating enzyme
MQTELKSYDRLEHNNPDHKNYVVINWCLGNTCNYACSYCPSSLHDASTPWPNFETVKSFIDGAISHFVGKKLYFEFTGGEVTLWKDLLPTAIYLKSKNCKVGIISNGSRSLDFFAKALDTIDHICLSFHPESAYEDHFFSVVQYCSERVRTHVNFMMDPKLFDRSLAFSMRAKHIPNISVAIQPLVKDLVGELLPYAEEQIQVMNSQNELLAKHIVYNKKYEYYRGAMAMVDGEGTRRVMAPHRFISSGNNNWFGWDCFIGLEQIVVDMEGDVFRGWCKVGGALGKIGDQELNFPKEAISCLKTNCHCNLDIMATKVKRDS